MSKKPSSIEVHQSTGVTKPMRRSFPGPRNAASPLRVAVDREAQGQLVAHARESLEAEICGVLAGQICEDESGFFTHVQVIVRGQAASSGSTHVTFTQEAWTQIHATMDRDYPKQRIVGWYHSHPGFGVEFSDMDLFIQQNFFSGVGQIGLVTDPLSGAVALITQFDDAKTCYLHRYWVEGRECQAQVPAAAVEPQSPSATSVPGGTQNPGGQSNEVLDARLTHLTQAVDGLEKSLNRFLFSALMLVCVGVAVAAGWFIYGQFQARNQPPQLNNYVPVPVKIGDKNVLLGVTVVSWEVPPELNSAFLEVEKQKRAEEAKAAAKAGLSEKDEAAPKAAPAAPASPTPPSAPSQVPPPASHP